jgi:hypothetical protein
MAFLTCALGQGEGKIGRIQFEDMEAFSEKDKKKMMKCKY